MNADGSDQRLVSTGQGRTTCSYFYPDGKHILYSSTHLSSPECPPRAQLFKRLRLGSLFNLQVFYATDKGRILKQLAPAPGYNREATLSADGKKIVFTSSRHGILEIYTMNPDGSGVKRLTNKLGYDGGAFLFRPMGNGSFIAPTIPWQGMKWPVTKLSLPRTLSSRWKWTFM